MIHQIFPVILHTPEKIKIAGTCATLLYNFIK